MRLTPIILSQYISSISSVFKLVGFIPAQLNTQSILPYLAMTSSMNLFTLSVTETSKADVKCSWAEEVAQRDWVSVREEGLTSCKAHVPPSDDSLIAVARPMPLPAPVMRIILFWKDGAMVK